MLSHDWLDRLGCLIGVVEGDRANVVVKNMGLDDAMKEGPADETKFAIDCRSGTASVGPRRWRVVG